MPAPTMAILIAPFFEWRGPNGSHAPAEQPRRAVPRGRIPPHLRPRRLPRHLRPVDRARRPTRPRDGPHAPRRAAAPAAAADLAPRAGPARARPALLGRGPGLRPRLSRPRDRAALARRRPHPRRDRGAP